jgi:ADP-ribose pyrophosphatase
MVFPLQPLNGHRLLLSGRESFGSAPGGFNPKRPDCFIGTAGTDTIEPFYQRPDGYHPMTSDLCHYRGSYLSMLERDGWEYSSRTNASGVVVIVAVTDRDELVLVEQYRPPVDRSVIELPAGLVGDLGDNDETILEAAARELEEETGFSASDIRLLLEAPSSAGMTDEIVSFILADGLRQVGPGGGDDSEDIRVHTVPMLRVDSWLREQSASGKLLDPKIFAALYWISQGRLNRTG